MTVPTFAPTAFASPAPARPAPDRDAVTGLVLAGGRGSRMGGVDKGLQLHDGRPLAAHALDRLRPQVGPLMVSANRHLDDYAALGVPVCTDLSDDRPGPLAGLEAGMANAATPWLVAVPCDAPWLPEDLVARLAAAVVAEDADIAIAAIRSTDAAERAGPRLQPVFCLVATVLHADLHAYLEDGGRRVEGWTARHRRAVVLFDDVDAFTNVNTLAELSALSGR